MPKNAVLGVLLVVSCGGARKVTNLDELRSGELVISGAQQACLNGDANQFSVFSSARAIPDQYLAVMVPGITPEAAAGLVARHQGTALFIPAAPVDAFAMQMSEAQARALAAEPGVCVVFQDYFVLE